MNRKMKTFASFEKKIHPWTDYDLDSTDNDSEKIYGTMFQSTALSYQLDSLSASIIKPILHPGR